MILIENAQLIHKTAHQHLEQTQHVSARSVMPDGWKRAWKREVLPRAIFWSIWMCRYGPRVRMGIYEGVPQSICPHSTSGRCDYWGPFVNRAARFANAAAWGGQITMPAAVGCALVLALTKQSLSMDSSEPVVLAHPDFLPQKQLSSAPAALPSDPSSPMRARLFEGASSRATTEVRGPW